MSIQELFRATGPITPSTEGVGRKSGVENEKRPPGDKNEFSAILQNEQGKQTGIHLSTHAETRIRSREIPWSAALEKRISKGMDQASQKGSRDALILADNIAVIANVRSRTVVTAMDRTQMKERIFTNIDSAVLV